MPRQAGQARSKSKRKAFTTAAELIARRAMVEAAFNERKSANDSVLEDERRLPC